MPLEFSGVRDLAYAFGALPAEVRRALKPGVVAAADIIADKTKDNAHFSDYIPGAVSVSASFSASGGGAVIRVKERGYPHAGEVRTFEGNGVSPTPFRHRVYGNRNAWVTAMTHPFLGPAVIEKEDEATDAIRAAVLDTVSRFF